MNYNQKLTSLANEFEATMNHADEVMNEIIATAFEQAMVEAFNELTPDEQMALIFGLLCEQVEDSIAEELTAVVEAIERAAQEEEMRRYEEERKREFFKELDAFFNKEREMLSGTQRRVATPEPEPTFLEVGLPEGVLKHLKRLGVKF
jgi:methyl-accepting chemotaxis protein